MRTCNSQASTRTWEKIIFCALLVATSYAFTNTPITNRNLAKKSTPLGFSSFHHRHGRFTTFGSFLLPSSSKIKPSFHSYSVRTKQYSTTSSSNSNINDATIAKQTKRWIQKVVIGLNFCPFAEKPMKQNKLQIHVIRGINETHIEDYVLNEMKRLQHEPGTSVIVVPDYYPDDFGPFMDFITYTLEGIIMEEFDLHGIIQVAPFHPRFEFEGSGVDGVDNLTNRSPFPIFHLLREEEVSDAVESLGGDAGKVWSRNVQLLSKLEEFSGKHGVEKIMRGEAVEGVDTLL